MLVSRVARKVKDTRLLKLRRRYLNAGHHEGRNGEHSTRGHAARQPAFTAVVEHLAG